MKTIDIVGAKWFTIYFVETIFFFILFRSRARFHFILNGFASKKSFENESFDLELFEQFHQMYDITVIGIWAYILSFSIWISIAISCNAIVAL